MNKYIFFVLLFLSGINLLSAAENLFKNHDFSKGKKYWEMYSVEKAINQGASVPRIVDGKIHVTLPRSKNLADWYVAVGQTIKPKLQAGKEYLASFTIEASEIGYLYPRLISITKNSPTIAYIKKIEVIPGKHRYSFVFVPKATPAAIPSKLRFDLGLLKGKIVLSDFKVSELVFCKLQLSDSWTLFKNAELPETTSDIPLELKSNNGGMVNGEEVTLVNNKVDIAPNESKKAHKSAVIYNEFTSDKAGVAQLGFSADWWMSVYVNGKKVYDTLRIGNKSKAFNIDDHVVRFPVKAGKNILAVNVLSGSKGWKFVCGIPAKPIEYQVNDEFKKVDMSDIVIKKGSALDLSSLVVTKPSGTYGRIVAGKDGKLVFEKDREKSLRLKGFDTNFREIFDLCKGKELEERNKLISDWVDMVARSGYNIVRLAGYLELFRGAKKDCDYNARTWDVLDRIIYELKKRGMYITLPITYGRLGYYGKRKDLKERIILGDEEVRQRWRMKASMVLNRMNPYTNLAYKDEPTIAFVEFFNELWGVLRWGGSTPEIKKLWNKKWQKWLQDKYHSLDNVAKAWGMPAISKYKSFSQIKKVESFKHSAKLKDYDAFIKERMRVLVDMFEATVRKIGYKGLTTQNNLIKTISSSELRWRQNDLVICNTYFRHPSMYNAIGSKCAQDSSVAKTADYFIGANSIRLSGRPFVVTEYNHSFWNKYQHEGGLLFGAYAAFQDFSGIIAHWDAVGFKINGEIDCFDVVRSPIMRANEFITSCLFLRGDVKNAMHKVELSIPDSFLQKDGNGAFAVNYSQNKLALLTGFSIAFPGIEKPRDVPQQSSLPDLTITPGKGAKIVSVQGASQISDSGDNKFDFAKVVEQLRHKGILKPDNITQYKKGIFQNETEELLLSAKEKLFKVNTPKTEGVSLLANKAEEIGAFNVLDTSKSSTIVLTSIDDKPLAESKRMVLVFSTLNVNTGMKVSSSRITLFNPGTLPVLLQCAQFKASLKTHNAASLKLYALGVNGTRKEELPLKIKGGELQIDIDTASLKDGPTPFFELSVE